MDLIAGQAAKINTIQKHIETNAAKMIELAAECGELLVAAKKKCKHGEWQAWTAANIRIKPRQIQRYMALAENWDAISNTSSKTHLTLEDALRSIKTPPKAKTPEVEPLALTANIETATACCPTCGGSGEVQTTVKEGDGFDDLWQLVLDNTAKQSPLRQSKPKAKTAYAKAIKTIKKEGVEGDNGERLVVSNPHSLLKIKIAVYCNSEKGKGKYCGQLYTRLNNEIWNEPEESWGEFNNQSGTFLDSTGEIF